MEELLVGLPIAIVLAIVWLRRKWEDWKDEDSAKRKGGD